MTHEAAEIAKLADDHGRMARSIAARMGRDPSFKELWARLERAEADRDRMMNALQLVLDRAGNGKVTLSPHTRTLIKRALSRIQPARAILFEKGEQA